MTRQEVVYDPDVDIDWNAPWRRDLFAMSPSRVTLQGTRVWSRLGEERQRELALQEAVSRWSVAAYLSAMLTADHLRQVASAGLNSKAARDSLKEVGGGARSTTTFGKLVRASGIAPYRLPTGSATTVKLLAFLPLGAASNAATLLVEQTVSTAFENVIDNETIEPHVRQAMKIQAAEAVSRFGYARDQVSRSLAASGPVRRAYHRVLLALLANAVLRLTVSPQVYRTVGVSPVRGYVSGRRNRHAARRRDAEPVVEFLSGVGMLDGALTSVLWRMTGVAPESMENR